MEQTRRIEVEGVAPARRLRPLPRATVCGVEVAVAATPGSRLLGLAGLRREQAGAGLLLERCGSVHTFGMRFALDLVFLGAAGEVLAVERGVPRRRLRRCRRARSVLELPAGTLPAPPGR